MSFKGSFLGRMCSPDLDRAGQMHAFVKRQLSDTAERNTFRCHVIWRNILNLNVYFLSTSHSHHDHAQDVWGGYWFRLAFHVYMTGTFGITIFDQQMCDRQDLEADGPALTWSTPNLFSQTCNAEFTGQFVCLLVGILSQVNHKGLHHG